MSGRPGKDYNMEQNSRAKQTGISGFGLKLTAIILMLIDHTGAVVIEAGILDIWNDEHFYQLLATDYGAMWLNVDMGLRLVGRLAFPIFCFLLVEGFAHTRNRVKYGRNMLIFAFLSEIPFDLAIFNQVFYLDYQNIYFTLLIGILVMMGMERTADCRFKQALVVVLGCLAANYLKTDYKAWGVLLIVAFYLFRGKKKAQLAAGGAVAAAETLGSLCAGALALIPISRYNGQPGARNLKYFFYWFYPAHLMVLYGIRLIFVK